MGLDMSMNGAGVCVFNDAKKMVHVEVIEPRTIGSSRVGRCIKNRQRQSDFVRYHEIIERVIQLAIAYRVAGVVIENYAFGIRKSKALTKLGELGGILRDKLIDNKIPWREVTTQTVKKYITGKGVCPEPVLLLRVVQKWSEEFESVKDRRKIDASIAYGLARIAWDFYSNKADWSKLLSYEAEALKHVQKEDGDATKKRRGK